MTRTETNEAYSSLLTAAKAEGPQQVRLVMAELGRRDLFFLLTRLLNRRDIDHGWLYARCREVQASPDGHLDLWAREHYKSTIITFGKTIQDILNDPEITVGIFSHTRPIAKSFLRQIKREMEENELLKELYPDVLYQQPRKDSPSWSEDGGIIVKRKTNPKEATVEAHGLVDGQPTSRHFSLLVYDDVVTRESVTTPDMIQKTTDALALSYNLGAHGGRRRFIGTRYHYNDTYRAIMDRKTATARIYPATENGKVDGTPVMLTRDSLAEKRRDMGPYVFACQMLQDPKADEVQGFQEKWIKYWPRDNFKGLNLYILGDPASSKKKTSDYTALFVVGLGTDQNYYVVDIIRDRLNLTERADALFDLHRKYSPIAVGYEKYGLQADIEHFEDRMRRDNYRFQITPLGGQVAKEDRIKALVPLFEQGRVYLPENLERNDYQGKRYDAVQAFILEEYMPFPVAAHDDMLDCLARIIDTGFPTRFPKKVVHQSARPAPSSWMGM